MKNSRVAVLPVLIAVAAAGADIRLGLAGTDTSHVTAYRFTGELRVKWAVEIVPGRPVALR